MIATTHYRPGACNIGDAEIRRRKQFGWAGFVVLIAAWAGLAIAGARPEWYFVLFIPAIAAAAGFAQAAYRFCFYFGFASMFNFGEAGQHARVAGADARRKDRRRALWVLTISALIALGLTLIAYGTATVFV